jgi:hypothetical protein
MTRRDGTSLVELTVSLTLFSVLLVTSLSFYHEQGDAFTEGNDRMTVMQNLRYVVNTVEQNVRAAGVGVPTAQPVLVYAGPDVLAFNADYATNRDNDFFAVYYDRMLPDVEASALDPTRRITIPHSHFAYPDSAFTAGGGNSPAETIILFFEPDSTTSRSDDYVLYRQVNDQPVDESAAGTPIEEVPSSLLPAAHVAAVHGGTGDTGAAALVDDIRAVRIAYTATNGLTGDAESVRQMTRMIRLPNAGLATQPNCGDAPILGSVLTATGVDPSGSVAGHIRLEWTRALDEVAGERDVLRYVIWRRPDDTGAWGDPLVSVAPGSSLYLFQDFSARADSTYSYAVAAQDCTPQYSPPAVSGTARWRE